MKEIIALSPVRVSTGGKLNSRLQSYEAKLLPELLFALSAREQRETSTPHHLAPD